MIGYVTGFINHGREKKTIFNLQRRKNESFDGIEEATGSISLAQRSISMKLPRFDDLYEREK
jgi:hypothetical protein